MFNLIEQFSALRAKVEQKAPPVVERRGKAKRMQLRVAGAMLLLKREARKCAWSANKNRGQGFFLLPAKHSNRSRPRTQWRRMLLVKRRSRR